MDDTPLILAEGVNHYFGSGPLKKQILFDVTTSFSPGEIVILTGPSGSGKTTLLTLAGALRSVQEGSMKVLGQELNGASPETLGRTRKSIGFIFQAHNLLDTLSARQNVQMSILLQGPMSKKEADERALHILDEVGLAHRVDYLPAQLSGGQKQRVAIARALVARPRIVLADEPTAALDKKSGREVVEILQRLAKEQGAAILLVTHDNRILDIADRILTLEDGRITSFAKGVTAASGEMLRGLSQLNRRGALVSHMRDLSPEKFVALLDESTRELEQLLQTLEAAEKQVSETMLDQVLDAATRKIVQMMGAERGAIFLKDDRANVLRSKVATKDKEERIEIVASMDRGIASHVARTGESINVADAQKHPLFNPEVDKETGFITHAVLCVPLLNRAGAVFGVVQILNKAGGGHFGEGDESALRNMAKPIGLILETCSRLKSGPPPIEAEASASAGA